MTRKKHELVVANHPSELAINTGPKWKDFSKFAKWPKTWLEPNTKKCPAGNCGHGI